MANYAIKILCTVTHKVFSSAAEAELAALFHNGKEACPLHITVCKQKSFLASMFYQNIGPFCVHIFHISWSIFFI
jgi:hypothetical protein